MCKIITHFYCYSATISVIQDFYLVDLNTIDDLDLVKDEMIYLRPKDIAHTKILKQKYNRIWCALIKVYLLAVLSVMQFSTPFVSTYLCHETDWTSKIIRVLFYPILS